MKKVCELFTFDGVYLHWTNAPRASRDNITKLVKQLQQALAPSAHRVGLVLPHDPEINAPGFDLKALGPALGDNTLLVLPPVFKDADYSTSKT